MARKKNKSSLLSDYIRPVVDAKYRTRSKAAKAIGIDESVLSRICSGQRVGVSEKVIEMICGRLGLDKKEGVLRLFFTKHRKMGKFFNTSIPIPFRIIKTNQNDELISSEKISSAYTPVPVVAINDLAKCISLLKREKEHVLVPNELADKEKNIKCCKVLGDSMAPMLQDESIIAVDLEIRKPENNGLFLLNWKNEIVVRRILFKDKYILFCSDNPDKDKYPIDVCTLKKANSFKDNVILGKVIWSMENP